MNKSIPIFNRLVVERDLKKKYTLHKQKIQEIILKVSTFQQPLISTKSQMNKSQVNRKAQMMDGQIDKANIRLLSKLSRIMNKSVQPVKQSTSPPLNREFRIKKLTQISQENQALISRLVQQKGQYGEERDHVKKCEYFMTNFNRFKPIGWEDERRSRSNQMSQTNNNFNQSYQSNVEQNNSLTPSHHSQCQEDQNLLPITTKRRNFAGNKFYESKPSDQKYNYLIQATDEQSSKVYRLQIKEMSKDQLITTNKCNEKDLEKIYFQKRELNYIEYLKPKRKSGISKGASEKRQNLFSREMYRTKFKPLESQNLPLSNPQAITQNQLSPTNCYMKVSNVLLETEVSILQNRDHLSTTQQHEETGYIQNLIESQINQSETLELQEDQSNAITPNVLTHNVITPTNDIEEEVHTGIIQKNIIKMQMFQDKNIDIFLILT